MSAIYRSVSGRVIRRDSKQLTLTGGRVRRSYPDQYGSPLPAAVAWERAARWAAEACADARNGTWRGLRLRRDELIETARGALRGAALARQKRGLVLP